MSRRALPYPCSWLPVPDRSWRPDGATLTAAEAMVCAVFVDRWRQSPADEFVLTTEEMAAASGLSVRGAETARASLVARAVVVKIHEGGGRGRPSLYRLGTWAKGIKETPQPNPATAAETPHVNPAASAWLELKPAANPARQPTVAAGFTAVTPFTKTEAEADPRERLRSAFDLGYARRYLKATTIAARGPQGRHAEELAAKAMAQPDPDAFVEASLDGYFSDGWAKGARFPIKHFVENAERYAAATVPQSRSLSPREEFERDEVSSVAR